eukprot:4004681-Amphidinium_carterae.1
MGETKKLLKIIQNQAFNNNREPRSSVRGFLSITYRYNVVSTAFSVTFMGNTNPGERLRAVELLLEAKALQSSAID